MKEFLSQHDVEFEIKDVHQDPEAKSEMMSMGFMSIPVAVIGDGEPILGVDMKKISAALGL